MIATPASKRVAVGLKARTFSGGWTSGLSARPLRERLDRHAKDSAATRDSIVALGDEKAVYQHYLSEREDDYALMEQIANGDADAMRALYDRYSAVVFALCRRMLRNVADAEELLLDTFFEAWQRSGRYDANRASPLTYLLLIARTRGLDRLRSKARERRVQSDDVPTEPVTLDDPSQPIEQSELAKCVRDAMAGLEPAQREAIESAYFDGLSHSEIARKLDKPLGTVKSHIRQGLIRLRDGLRNT